MFDTILIANRGEIACRVIRSARNMGIRTVAVFSDADRGALHARLADEAVHLGASESARSYLAVDKIIAACVQTGAQAVHPGYGFLAESASFAEALDAAGITFIGPGPRAISSMGDKIAAKLLADKAGVNTIPGCNETIDGPDDAVKVARTIGYPVMLKASAGGGGKGMRVVRNDEECRDGFERAASEAKAAFGDDRIFAERFIENPRHIEIQVLADAHGNVIHLGERECSIQRRHQKVIEEAPSPFLDPATRKAMGEQAVALARAVDYRSAGTVEFIVDAERNFYFLEMNTRLQVEHPVTEMITGLDLVELMIRVAAGEELPLAQEDVKLTGWAVEARVYAEDPFRNFIPSLGRLVRYQAPQASGHVRVDTGVEEGSEVSRFYDSMIAKLVTCGEDRAQAIARMNDALDAYCIRGISHNISFLNAVMAHPRFLEGRLTTNFIAEAFPDGFRAADVPHDEPGLPLAMAAVVHRAVMDRAATLGEQSLGCDRRVGDDFVVIVGGEQHPTRVTRQEAGYQVAVGASVYRIVINWRMGEHLVRAEVDGRPICFQLDRVGLRYRLSHRGLEIDALVVTPRAAELATHMRQKEPADLSRFLLSPMPGLLIHMAVRAGDKIRAGEELVVVEAMKMENSLRAAEDAVVAKVLVDQGQSVMVDQPILEFE